MVFFDWDVLVKLPQTSDGALKLSLMQTNRIGSFRRSSLAQVCSSSIPQALIRAVEHLYILEDRLSDWQDDIENGQWPEVLRPLTGEGPVYATYRACPEGACWRKGDRSVTRPADSFLRGATLSPIE